MTFNSFTGSLESKANILEPAVVGTLFGDLLANDAFAVQENAFLFLESFFVL
jgi:hypothetical protein